MTVSELLDKLNEAYGAKKLRRAGFDLWDVAPELWPKIQSDGVECLVELFAEELAKRDDALIEFGKALLRLDERIKDLERRVKDGGGG